VEKPCGLLGVKSHLRCHPGANGAGSKKAPATSMSDESGLKRRCATKEIINDKNDRLQLPGIVQLS
jgi:hypothetical protein